MPSRNGRFNIELLLGVSATFLSLAALIVSIFQTKIAREQQQASVWPHLQADYQVANSDFAWSIINNGVGPAIIKSVHIQYQNRHYKNAQALITEQIRRIEKDQITQHYETYYGGVGPGGVVKSDGELTLGRVNQNERMASALLQVIQDPTYRFTVVYSDVYGNCWQLDRNKVTPLGECPE